MIYYFAGILVAIASSTGQILFKFSSRRLLQRERKQALRLLWSLLFDPFFVSGAVLFILSAATSVWALTHIEFSVYYAISALNYLFITLLSRIVLGETVDFRKILGNAIVVLGILVYAVS